MNPTKEELTELYNSIPNISDLATKLSVSRPTVYSWLVKHGISRNVKSVEVPCYTCGGPAKKYKKLLSKSVHNFCKKSCYTDYQKTAEFRESLNVKRIARVTKEEENARNGI